MFALRRAAVVAATAAASISSGFEARAQTRAFNLPAQPASAGVPAFARQADAQVLISGQDARGRRTNALVGPYTVGDGLAVLLRGSGLAAFQSAQGAYVVAPSHRDETTVIETTVLPEILVEGGARWSLNTSLPHTRDDAQPYQIYTREEIARSGAGTLAQFLAEALGPSTSVGPSGQSETFLGQSQIRLRGLTLNETLILQDGRRLASLNTGSGFLEQPALIGIALAQVERIEVLPASASSVHGGGAAGGVINIIMRRAAPGLETRASWTGATDGAAPEYRLDVSVGRDFEDGRTRISAFAAWRDAAPLRMGERDFRRAAFERIEAAGGDYFDRVLVLGATPNIISVDGDPLVLDAGRGGQALGSNRTFAPPGYRGIALDGVAGLVANAGGANLELAPNAAGTDGVLVPGQHTGSAAIAVRREMTSWLRVYGEAQASVSRLRSAALRGPPFVTLAADAINNPFQQDIYVATPHRDADGATGARIETRRFIAGAIVRLPAQWQANLDYTWDWSGYARRLAEPGFDVATLTALRTGAVDVTRDPALAPLSYGYLDLGSEQSLSKAGSETLSLRLAGRLPLRLPGGAPSAVVLLERSEQRLGLSRMRRSTADSSLVADTPERSQDTDSVYAELWAPVVGPGNHLPLVHALGVGLSVRRDAYEAWGAEAEISCISAERPLTIDEFYGDCSAPSAARVRQRAVRARADPTYSARWSPVPDVALRASYGTGYVPPFLHRLIRQPTPFLLSWVRDPVRGGEAVGAPLAAGVNLLSGPGNFIGGNAEAGPERSASWSAGVILTPRWAAGLRLSMDWTRIRKTDSYYDPLRILSPVAGDPQGQARFEAFLSRYPERFVRAAPSGGFEVGPIVAADLSTANFGRALVETWDFALDYGRDLRGGRLTLRGEATWLARLSVQDTPASPAIDWAGVINGLYAEGFGFGGVSWKGSATASWSNEVVGLGWSLRFFDDYFVRQDRSVTPILGVARVPSQIYHDLVASWAVRDNLELRLGIANVLNAGPPVDLGAATYHSRLADPRMRSARLTLTRRF